MVNSFTRKLFLAPTAIFLFSLISILPCAGEAFTANFSIRPLAGIGAAIAKDSSIQTSLILAEPVSPHEFALKPSHILKLQRADMVVIVDRNFEMPLNEALDKYASKKLVEASKLPGVALLGRVYLRMDEAESYRVRIHEKRNRENTSDYHLWLSPKNALSIAASLRDRFAAASPSESETFHNNYDAFAVSVSEADVAAQKTFRAQKLRPFAVYHDSFRYFSQRYFLQNVGAISEGGEGGAGPRRLQKILDLIAARKAACVFYEPAEGAEQAKAVAERAGVSAAEIDPFGQSIPLDENFYSQLITQTTAQFVRCLKPVEPIHQ